MISNCLEDNFARSLFGASTSQPAQLSKAYNTKLSRFWLAALSFTGSYCPVKDFSSSFR